VRTRDPGVGMGIEFTGLPEDLETTVSGSPRRRWILALNSQRQGWD
jgi:hypothetical protein